MTLRASSDEGMMSFTVDDIGDEPQQAAGAGAASTTNKNAETKAPTLTVEDELEMDLEELDDPTTTSSSSKQQSSTNPTATRAGAGAAAASTSGGGANQVGFLDNLDEDLEELSDDDYTTGSESTQTESSGQAGGGGDGAPATSSTAAAATAAATTAASPPKKRKKRRYYTGTAALATSTSPTAAAGGGGGSDRLAASTLGMSALGGPSDTFNIVDDFAISDDLARFAEARLAVDLVRRRHRQRMLRYGKALGVFWAVAVSRRLQRDLKLPHYEQRLQLLLAEEQSRASLDALLQHEYVELKGYNYLVGKWWKELQELKKPFGKMMRWMEARADDRWKAEELELRYRVFVYESEERTFLSDVELVDSHRVMCIGEDARWRFMLAAHALEAEYLRERRADVIEPFYERLFDIGRMRLESTEALVRRLDIAEPEHSEVTAKWDRHWAYVERVQAAFAAERARVHMQEAEEEQRAAIMGACDGDFEFWVRNELLSRSERHGRLARRREAQLTLQHLVSAQLHVVLPEQLQFEEMFQRRHWLELGAFQSLLQLHALLVLQLRFHDEQLAIEYDQIDEREELTRERRRSLPMFREWGAARSYVATLEAYRTTAGRKHLKARATSQRAICEEIIRHDDVMREMQNEVMKKHNEQEGEEKRQQQEERREKSESLENATSISFNLSVSTSAAEAGGGAAASSSTFATSSPSPSGVVIAQQNNEKNNSGKKNSVLIPHPPPSSPPASASSAPPGASYTEQNRCVAVRSILYSVPRAVAESLLSETCVNPDVVRASHAQQQMFAEQEEQRQHAAEFGASGSGGGGSPAGRRIGGGGPSSPARPRVTPSAAAQQQGAAAPPTLTVPFRLTGARLRLEAEMFARALYMKHLRYVEYEFRIERTIMQKYDPRQHAASSSASGGAANSSAAGGGGGTFASFRRQLQQSKVSASTAAAAAAPQQPPRPSSSSSASAAPPSPLAGGGAAASAAPPSLRVTPASPATAAFSRSKTAVTTSNFLQKQPQQQRAKNVKTEDTFSVLDDSTSTETRNQKKGQQVAAAAAAKPQLDDDLAEVDDLDEL